jgi:hypothetical protein
VATEVTYALRIDEGGWISKNGGRNKSHIVGRKKGTDRSVHRWALKESRTVAAGDREVCPLFQRKPDGCGPGTEKSVPFFS